LRTYEILLPLGGTPSSTTYKKRVRLSVCL
jgi:hypothetical protein